MLAVLEPWLSHEGSTAAARDRVADPQSTVVSWTTANAFLASAVRMKLMSFTWSRKRVNLT